MKFEEISELNVVDQNKYLTLKQLPEIFITKPWNALWCTKYNTYNGMRESMSEIAKRAHNLIARFCRLEVFRTGAVRLFDSLQRAVNNYNVIKQWWWLTLFMVIEWNYDDLIQFSSMRLSYGGGRGLQQDKGVDKKWMR